MLWLTPISFTLGCVTIKKEPHVEGFTMLSQKSRLRYIIILILILSGLITACQRDEKGTASETPNITELWDTERRNAKNRERQILTGQCDKNDYEACAKLSKILNDLYIDKEGRRDQVIFDEIGRINDKACNGGIARSCLSVAHRLISYVRTPESIDAGFNMMREYCNSGYELACREYTLFLSNDSRFPESREAALMYCKLAGVEACHDLTSEMISIRRDADGMVGARELSAYGCDEGHLEACIRVASLLKSNFGGETDPSRVKTYLARICDLSNGKTCWDAETGAIELDKALRESLSP